MGEVRVNRPRPPAGGLKAIFLIDGGWRTSNLCMGVLWKDSNLSWAATSNIIIHTLIYYKKRSVT